MGIGSQERWHDDHFKASATTCSTTMVSRSPVATRDGTLSLLHMPNSADCNRIDAAKWDDTLWLEEPQALDPATPASALPPGHAPGELQDLGPPPDGGKEAWLCVLGTFFHLFCIFGLRSVQPLMVFFPSVFMGRYFDVHGARALVIGGTTVAFGALVGLAFSKEFYQILLSHMAFGLSGGLIYTPATAVAGHWFLKRRGLAVGIIVGGSGLGGVIYPIMIKELLKSLSFRDTILIIAGFNLILMLPACYWMKGRLLPRSPPPWSNLAKPWRQRRFVFLSLGTAMYAMNILSPYFNAATMAASNDCPPALVDYAVAILQAGSFVGRILAGRLADRWGVWVVFGSIPFLTSASLFAFWVGEPLGAAPTVIGLVLYGALSGGWFTLAAAATAAISPIEEVGTRIGIMWSGISVPMLVGPVIAGKLISIAGDRFMYAGIWAGSTMLLSGLLSVGPLIGPNLAAFNKRRLRKHSQCELGA